MRLLIQRVKSAEVSVNHHVCGKIGHGMLVFLGVHKNDTPEKVTWLVKKLLGLRIFIDENGKMNRDILEVGGNILLVSQFTLYGNCMNGRRPDFIEAALPELALPLYEQFASELSNQMQKKVQTGIFGASMEVSLVNDGPVTFLLEK